MSSAYINWCRYDQKNRASTLPTEGTIIAGEKVSFTTSTQSGVAPTGAQYATIWADAPFHVAYGSNPTATATTGAYPANTPVQIPHIDDGVTKIAFLDIT